MCNMEQNLLQTTCCDEMQSKYHPEEKWEHGDQNNFNGLCFSVYLTGCVWVAALLDQTFQTFIIQAESQLFGHSINDLWEKIISMIWDNFTKS